MKDFAAKLTAQLGELTSMVRSDLSNEVRKKVNQLIIIDVHARDIIDTFVRDSVMDAREFAWESQLRFYWDRAQDDILIRQVRRGAGPGQPAAQEAHGHMCGCAMQGSAWATSCISKPTSQFPESRLSLPPLRATECNQLFV